MKIPFSRSRERLSHSFGGRKKTKKNKKQTKNKKTTAKHIHIRLLPEDGCVKEGKGKEGQSVSILFLWQPEKQNAY